MSDLGKMLGPMARRIGNMIARGTVAMSTATSKMQGLQLRLLAGEVKDNVEHFEPFGFTSKPLPGAEAVAVFLDGDRSHGIVVVVADRRYRLQGLEDGEAALHDDQGQKVHLKRDGIVIETSKKCRIEARDIELHASQSYSWDVGGYGERWTFLGGNTWEHKTWQQGAAITNVTLPVNPPEGP